MSAARRFVPPPRGEVDATCWNHPLLAPFTAWQSLLQSPDWPDIAALNARLSVPGKRFVQQDAALLADGLHYELRSGQGAIATRPQNWHDLFNALTWARYPAVKRALNARQCAEVARVGTAVRSAAQNALTQLDECGVIVRLSAPHLLSAWDAHDWQSLFIGQAAAWQDGSMAIAASLGHALLEQCLLPGRRLVGKALVVLADDDATALACVADAISRGAVLQQAAELRPLPLAGIAGWHAAQDDAFYADADYFRPLREGRVYPRPLTV